MRIVVGTRASESVEAAKRLVDDVERSGISARVFLDGPLSTNLWKGRYEVRGLLATGGQGAVFELVDLMTMSHVVGKVFDRKRARDWDGEKLFRRECEALARIAHPLVPRFVDAMFDDDVGVGVLVMERFFGETLEGYVARRGAISADDVPWMLADALNALSALHAEGLVHRDVKPGNLMLVQDNSVRLIDFGAVGEMRIGSETLGVGTLAYMAPEQLHGERSVRSDLYSLAMTMVAVGAGPEASALPRRGETVDVKRAVPGFARSLQRVLVRMLAPRPSDRPGSTQEVARALGALALRRRPEVPLVFIDVPSLIPEPLAERAAAPSVSMASQGAPEAPTSAEWSSSRAPARRRCTRCDRLCFVSEPVCSRCGHLFVPSGPSMTAPPALGATSSSSSPSPRRSDVVQFVDRGSGRDLLAEVRGGTPRGSDDGPAGAIEAAQVAETWEEVARVSMEAAPGWNPALRVSYFTADGSCIGTESLVVGDRESFTRWWT